MSSIVFHMKRGVVFVCSRFHIYTKTVRQIAEGFFAVKPNIRHGRLDATPTPKRIKCQATNSPAPDIMKSRVPKSASEMGFRIDELSA